MSYQMLNKNKIKEFVLAGNAIITLQSGQTGKHFTYKITRDRKQDTLYTIRLLYGADNTHDYAYIGCYYSNTKVFHLIPLYLSRLEFARPPAIRAITYFFNRIDNIPHNLYVYHHCRCGRCGRLLTTPESIERGYGPECIDLIKFTSDIRRPNT